MRHTSSLMAAAIAAIMFSSSATAQKVDSIAKYRRSSICSILITHLNEDKEDAKPEEKYHHLIQEVFTSMPMPDKFNEHNIQQRFIASSEVKAKKAAENKHKQEVDTADIEKFILDVNPAKEMVAKWFNRNPETGDCNMDLVSERGYYDAQQVDIRLAKLGPLGVASLADAGAELIGKTFLLVNDITYVDVGERTAKAGQVLGSIGRMFGGSIGNSFKLAGSLTSSFDGLKVNITSFLYQLDWQEKDLYNFWDAYYLDPTYSEEDHTRKRESFASVTPADSVFRIKYIGKTTTSAHATIFRKNAPKNNLMLRVCARAIDKSIIELQRQYDTFKVSVPIDRVNADGTVDVPIGLKEGVHNKSVFDVFQQTEDQSGKIQWQRVGRIEAINGKIWDNRFGALEELQEAKEANAKIKDEDAKGVKADATLTATTFKILSGASKIDSGCIVREADDM